MATDIDNTLQVVLNWLTTTGLKLLGAVVVFIVAWIAIKIITKMLKKILSRSKIGDSAAGFLISVLKAIMWGIAVLTAVGQVVNLNSMITALGAAGLTASFALQGSLGNFVSGMQIIFSNPFVVGNYIAVDNKEGTVSRIDILNTTLISFDNKEIIIPNSKITSGIVVNFTSQPTRRLDLSYSVSYNTDLALVKSVLTKLIENDERILKEPEPIVAVGSHKDSSIEVMAKIWVNNEDYWALYWDMQERVKNAFDENNISIPFPQLDVHTK